MKKYAFLISSYFVLTGSAFAQGLSVKSAELSLSIGGTSFSKKTFTIGLPQSSTPINGVMELSSGKMYEARINFYNSNRIGSEVLYGYQYGGVTFRRTSDPASSFSAPLQVHTLTLNLLFATDLAPGTQTRVNPNTVALTSFTGSVVITSPVKLAVSSDQFEGTTPFEFIYPSEFASNLIIPFLPADTGSVDVNVFNPGPNQAEVKVVLMQSDGTHTQTRTASVDALHTTTISVSGASNVSYAYVTTANFLRPIVPVAASAVIRNFNAATAGAAGAVHSLVPFMDTGNVWVLKPAELERRIVTPGLIQTLPAQFLPGTNSGLRMSTGIEFQVVMPVLNAPFRVDFAFNPARIDQNFVGPVTGTPFGIHQPSHDFKFTVGRTF